MTSMLDDVPGAADKFASEAERYVQWQDRTAADESSTVNMRELHELLGTLQVAAARLPKVAPGEEAEADAEYEGGAEIYLRK
jgi:hypothetical protein